MVIIECVFLTWMENRRLVLMGWQVEVEAQVDIEVLDFQPP
jgi:hypothetical protein